MLFKYNDREENSLLENAECNMWFSNFLLESDDLLGDLGLAISIRECALASQCDILW